MTTSGDLALTGPVQAGTVHLSAAGITLSGAVQTGALSINATGAVIQTGGTLTAASLSGSATGPVSLGGAGQASIATLGNLSAGGALTLTDAAALQLTGALAAPSLAITATGAMTLSGGVITTSTGLLALQPAADGTARLLQTGTTAIAPPAGGTVNLMITLPPTGGAVQFAGLDGPFANLTLALGTGSAIGVVLLDHLFVIGAGGSAHLTGQVDQATGFTAAQDARISPQLSLQYQLNGCAIQAVTCTPDQAFLLPQSVLRPDLLTLDVLDLSVTRDRDDPTLLLPNISDRDY